MTLSAAIGGARAREAAAADPVLGLADDGGLVTNPVNPDAVLLAGAARGMRFVRLVAYMGSYPDDDRYVHAAERAAAHGLGLDVVLALPWSTAQAGVEPSEFAAWAARLAERLSVIGAPLRLSVLNEPDLLLAASDDCNPLAVNDVVRSAGYIPTKRRVRVAVRRSRLVARSRVLRSGGHPARTRRRPDRARHRTHRRGRKTRVVWTSHVWKTLTFLRPVDSTIEVSRLTVRQGCLSIQRARRAAAFLAAAIPAVRRTAPGVEVGAGETSPVAGVDVFIRELARQGIPPIDRWAHHPYPCISGGTEVACASGEIGSSRLGEYAALIHELFGATLPLDLTEFGVLHRSVGDAGVRASIWRTLFARACDAGARTIVVYQWTPTPDGEGRTWDTSILGVGLSETPESTQLSALSCATATTG